MSSKSPIHHGNVCIKILITLFCAFGLFLALYSTLSCRWFVFNQDNLSFEAWNFVPSKNDTVSIGLFRYQTTPDANQEDLMKNLAHCSQFEPLFVGTGDPIIFTAQLCVIIGPIIAFVAWLLAMVGVNKGPTTFLLFLASSVQTTSIVASMSWCKSFWDCQLQPGGYSNIGAAGLFFLSWFLGVCCLVNQPLPAKEIDVEESGDEESHTSRIVAWSSNMDFKFDDET